MNEVLTHTGESAAFFTDATYIVLVIGACVLITLAFTAGAVRWLGR
jgi:hypothetical protein